MPITVPVDGQEITVSAFGAPVANAINALAPTSWTNVTYQNSWADYAGAQRFQYRKIGDMVWLRGTFGGGTAAATITIFPVGFRPPVYLELNALSYVSGQRVTVKCDAYATGEFSCEISATAISINIAFSTTA